MKSRFLGLLTMILLVSVTSVSFAENPIHVYLSAFGNANDGDPSLRTMYVHGLCYQVMDNTLWVNQLEKSDKVSQVGGTVFFDLNLYQQSDQFEFQVMPGSTFTCRGYTIQSDGTYNSFNITRKGVKLGSIREKLVFQGPNYYKTIIGIQGQND